MKPATAHRGRVEASRDATALENRARLRALVLAAHAATADCVAVLRQPTAALDLRALSAALDTVVTAASRARNRAVLDDRAEREADR